MADHADGCGPIARRPPAGLAGMPDPGRAEICARTAGQTARRSPAPAISAGRAPALEMPDG